MGKLDLDDMIASLQMKKDAEDMGYRYDIEKKDKLLVEKLEDLLKQNHITDEKKVREFIESI